jgi:isoquinoline 1-oxidoreductase beta subunit
MFNHRPEMGQGTFQAIPMILAEELEVDINKVHIKQSAASRELYGSQMVVGSRSIQTEFDKLRIMGATARDMLRQAAANRWGVSIDECLVSDGSVKNARGEQLKYSELVVEASNIEAPASPKLKKPADFKVIGRSVPRQDIPLKTNGEAKFGIDLSVPGMLHATIERSPLFLATVLSFNEDEVLQVPGVKHVYKTSRNVYGRTREGVAVLADSYWAAQQGRHALRVKWDNQGLEKINDETIEKDSMEAAMKAGDELFATGDATKALAKSTKVIEASYMTPYQAHVPMEPMNAMVSIGENEAEFWGSTQNPNGIKSFIARKYNIPEGKVKINYTFMGGGFGRRSMTDVVEEAADLSQKTGTPVKVIWSREDDQTQGPFRACSLNVCKGLLDANGRVTALEHKVIAQEIRNQTGDNMTAGRQLMGGINTDYLIPNYSVRGVLQKRHIPISYWRAVYHSTNPFAHESFIDELAYSAGKDPIKFRLAMLEHPRYVRVLEEAAKLTGWYQPKPTGVGRGVATVERSGAYFAMVVEVTKKNNRIVPTKITTVIDLGICINPDTVKAQTEGSIIMGLGAVYAGLNIKGGAIEQTNFDTYPLLRMSQTPEIVTHILKSDAAPDGAGETGLPTVAPALVNAIFDLTGKRIRKLPLDPGKIV